MNCLPFAKALGFAVLLSCAVASAKDAQYCAFEVTVRTPAGAPVTSAPVEELEQNSERIIGEAQTDSHGIARICEAPAKDLVSIRVGGKLCGATTVSYLKPFWMETRRVYMTYENCSGEEWIPMGGCGLTIRVLDEAGAPLLGVRFETADDRPRGRDQTTISDETGRIFRFMNYGDRLTGRLVTTGYAAEGVADDCQRGSDTRRERVVVLRRGQVTRSPK